MAAKLKSPALESKSSALVSGPAPLLQQEPSPPTTRVFPLFRRVDECRLRAVLRLPGERNTELIVHTVAPLMAPDVAWILLVPGLTAFAKPEAALMVATVVAEELQLDVLVKSCVLPSV